MCRQTLIPGMCCDQFQLHRPIWQHNDQFFGTLGSLTAMRADLMTATAAILKRIIENIVNFHHDLKVISFSNPPSHGCSSCLHPSA